MDYRRVYLSIIKNAIKENRKKHNGVYYELHHILPKSLFPLWKRRKSNLVLLTAREHFFCHLLLTKIYSSPEMDIAAFVLGRNSKEYQRLKEKHAIAQKEIWKFRNKEEYRKLKSIQMKSIWEKINESERAAILANALAHNTTDKMIQVRRDNREEIAEKIRKAWENKDTSELSKKCKLFNSNKAIIEKRAKSISEIKKKQANDFESPLRQRLLEYNEKKKIKIKCLETCEIFNSRKEVLDKYGWIDINVKKNKLAYAKRIDDNIIHFEVI